MFVHPQFDPVAIHITSSFGIHWYGLTYFAAFMAFLWLGKIRIKRLNQTALNQTLLDDLLFFGVLGVVLGGRLGYVLFYKLSYYMDHPLEIIAVWQGGMSFHGGFLGVLIAMWWIARTRGLKWLQITDFIAPLVPLGLAFGRLGNFINGELWGRTTEASWGMIFPQAGDNLPRHPSQLYQFALEGLLLFIILWWFARKPRPMGMVSGVFLLGYGSFRFIAEFAREPDDFLGLLSFGLSMGQWLSLPMILIGIGMVAWSKKRAQSLPKQAE